MASSIGFTNGVLNSELDKIGVHRLGIKYDSGTFSLINANGVDLSEYNPAYATIPKKGSQGESVTYTLTSNLSFQDAAGSGQVTGNEFGTVLAAISSDAVPFYIYLAADDNSANVKAFLCRFPNLTKVPASAAIGTPSSPTADLDGDFWSFEDITAGDYDGNPAICVGGIRMTQTGTWDWTVTTPSDSDGIGKFFESVSFVWRPILEGDSTAGSFTYTTQAGNYHFNRDGTVNWSFAAITSASSGSPAGAVRTTAPFFKGSNTTVQDQYGPFWCSSVTTVPASTNQITAEMTDATRYILFRTVVFGTSNSYLQVDATGDYRCTMVWQPAAQQTT